MFRRRKKLWHPRGDFPTASVQRLPCQRQQHENKILYTTRFEPQNAEQCGIFEYDVESKENTALKLWTDINYFPRWDVSVYNESEDSIIFIGGANVQQHHHRYDILLIYNLKQDSVTKYKLPILIGGNARVCLSHNNRYMHVIGGTSNDMHIMYDIESLHREPARPNKIKYMYCFREQYPQIQSCGLLYNSRQDQLYMFGGRSSAQRVSFSEFWLCDQSQHLSMLSMQERSWLLVNGWITQHMMTSNSDDDDEDMLIYPIELNSIILTFLGVSNTIHTWLKNETWLLPAAIYQFGYVLYRERVIITFGGRDESNECVDTIYYLDTTDKETGWQTADVKCPKASTYNAVLMDDDTVHIVPFYVHSDHFSIPVSKVLPGKLMEQIRIDMRQYCDEDSSGVVRDKEVMVLRQHRRFLHKVMAMMVVGVLIAVLGVLLCMYVYEKDTVYLVLGVAMLVIGVTLIAASLVYGRFYRPVQPEYLLN